MKVSVICPVQGISEVVFGRIFIYAHIAHRSISILNLVYIYIFHKVPFLEYCFFTVVLLTSPKVLFLKQFKNITLYMVLKFERIDTKKKTIHFGATVLVNPVNE
jgi:hypothetical protein